MTSNTKTKLCWNCEARVEKSQEHCSFCGVYLSPEFTESSKAILSPLYRFDEEEVEKTEGDSADEKEPIPIDGAVVSKIIPMNSFALALMLLFFGTTFFLFSVALALFSQEGVLTLHWNSGMWPWLLVCSLAASFGGWHLIAKALE